VHRNKAFSLIELMLAMAISALLVAMAMVNMWPARTAANSHSLADSLAEELRLARRSAVASGVPVSVSFATNGLGPQSQAIYTLSGAHIPQLNRVRNFSQEFSGTYLCLGSWGFSGGSWTHTQPKPMSNSDTFDPTAWNNPVNNLDPTLIFTPAGSVTSNGMARCNGNFYLVASQGVQFQTTSISGSGPSLSYFSLQRLAKPYTISITPAGHITVEPGLTGNDGTVALQDRSLETPAAPAPPPAVLPANTSPTITACQITPEPPDGSAGGVAVLAPEEHLCLRVTASDAQGDRLYCSWTADGGVFSSAIEDRMEWDGSQWVSNWEWRPPSGVQSGNYSMTCTVRDPRGGSVVGGANGSVSVTLQQTPTVVFGAATADSPIPKQAKRIHLNGTGEKILRSGSMAGDWTASPDGSELVFTYGSLTYACHADGTGERMLSIDVNSMSFFYSIGSALWGKPSFSPEGTRVICSGMGTAGVDLFLSDLQGGVVVPFASGSKDETFPMWSADGRFIVYRLSDDTTSEIMVKLATGGPAILLSAGMPGDQCPIALSPNQVNGHYRLLYKDSNGGLPLRVMDFDSAGVVTNPVVGSLGPYNSLGPGACLSPDGSKVAFTDSAHVYIANSDGSNQITVPSGSGGGQDDAPKFTPDGTQVVFWSNRFCPGDPWRGDLFRVRTDGTSLLRITRGNQVLTKVLFPFAGWDIVP